MNQIQREVEEITMADLDTRTLSEHTLSTGASTPFTFSFEDQGRNLFR